jgi:LPS export ABC transporter permease LptG
MRLLDRYLLSNFFVPFSLCFGGFLGIWLVFDLSGNVQDFLSAQASFKFIVYFYLTQLPQTMLLCLPVGLLLALLFAMSKMSRSNEIIAMLTAGRSLARLLAPLILAGVLISGVSLALNYKLAPHAEAMRKRLLWELGQTRKKSGDKQKTVEGQLFRNRVDYRTWFVSSMPMKPNNKATLHGLHIMQQDAEGNVLVKWYARRATYNETTKTWLLTQGKTVKLDRDGNIVSDTPFSMLQLDGWSENPWRIGSTTFEAQSLSVAELRDYLHYNADFPEAALAAYKTHLQNRWALPWQCLAVVFFAAPLGIVYSRRGMLSGVAGAIFCFAAMLFLNALMMALGKGSRIPPVVAAWSPTLLFLLLGMGLLYCKATNRDLPKLSQLLRFR